jgi:hypothetical protein
MDLQELLLRLLKAQLVIGSSAILWREIIGNGFGLASAIFGMRRMAHRHRGQRVAVHGLRRQCHRRSLRYTAAA